MGISITRSALYCNGGYSNGRYIKNEFDEYLRITGRKTGIQE